MEQSSFASYVLAPYHDMAGLPVSSMPSRSASNGPATSNPQQHLFNENSYSDIVPQDMSNVPVSRVEESYFDPWLMEISTILSPELSGLCLSPCQSVASPPSERFYSPPCPEQLQLPAYELLEQPQQLQTFSTNYFNRVNSGYNWQRNCSESDVWGTQPFVAQPWIPHSHDGYIHQNVAPNYPSTINGVFTHFKCAEDGQFPTPEDLQTRPVEVNGGSPLGEEGEDSPNNDSDSDEETSDSSSESKLKSNSRPLRVHFNRWTVPNNGFRQSDLRGHVCDVPNCGTGFVRPEHLRRHLKSKHTQFRPFVCKVSGCERLFSRGDNLRDHYWTHLYRGGRAGKNRKMTLPELKLILGSKEKNLIKRLREKQRRHMEGENKKKKQQAARRTYTVRPKL